MHWGIPNKEFIDFISKEVFEDKVYEKFYEVKEGDIVVDVGASAGPFTHSILHKKPKHVYCIEPSKNFFATLSENAKGHPVTCINKAIVSKTHTSEDTKKLHVFWTDTLDGIETTTFKSFLSDNNIDSINMMKMDCEGGEYDILTEENLDFIINRVDNIAAEIHFVWYLDKLHHKFKHFRENILPKIPNYKLFSVEQDQASIAVDITDKIYIPNYVESRYNQIMLYVQKEPFAGTKGKRKIVDCFRFFNEKEMLELRYKMLSDVVDKFVVLEGTKTFSGNDWQPCARKFVQELNIPEEKFLFVETDLPGNDQYIENNALDYTMRSKSGPSNDSYKNSLNARTRERLSIDGLLTVLDQFGNDDVFFVSDVDEIIKPTCVEYFADVASRNIHELIKVPLVELQGRANLRAHDRKTDTPLSTDNVFFIATKKHFARATPFQLRYGLENHLLNLVNPFPTVYITQDGKRIEDAGWHFSWMGDADRLKLKQKSTSHYADRIESSVIKDMDSQELQEYMENWNPKDNPMSLNTWGDTNTVLKKYDLSSLPKELLENKHLASFFLQEEDPSLLQKEVFEQSFKDSNHYDVHVKTTILEKNKLSSIVEEAFKYALEKESHLPSWLLNMEGMSGKKYRTFVNKLISLLDSPRYLEIGCWKGSTACSAIYSNSKAVATLIDNWSQFGGPREEFNSNLLRCVLSNNTSRAVECIDEDFKTVKYDSTKKYNIYFFDGPHTEDDHFESLVRTYNALDEEFIFICDDWNWSTVRDSTKKSIENLNLNVAYSIEVFSEGKEAGNEGQFSDWHNGYFIAVCKKSQQKSKKPIPVMGVPVVNGLHWLRRLIDSIDYPVEELFIVNNNGKEELTEELDKIAKTPHKYVNKIKVTHLPHNLGCSGAWNLIIKCYMKSPYWLIVNNDVAFTPGLLEKMNDAALNSDAEMIHCKMSQWGSIKGGAYDLFIITQSAVQKCGLFDENLYPIYAEDVDYSIRLANENVKTLNLDINYLHGEKDYETSGSQTWRLDPTNLKDKMDNGRVMNETVYLYKKWGHDFYSNSPYSRPFNNENLDSRYTTYDLEFVRKKHLGF